MTDHKELRERASESRSDLLRAWCDHDIPSCVRLESKQAADHIAELIAALDEQQGLRELLWLRHGCRITDLYGDDGEMQCSKCQIDFKRWPVSQIIESFERAAESAKEAGND